MVTWLVTGCSSGLGEEFILHILARGDKAIATARKGTTRLQKLKEAGAYVYDLDVTDDEEKLKANVAKIIEEVGQIDVLVNNAGYIESVVVEESSYEQWLSQYNTNFFGTIKMTQAVLPHFRERKTGTIAFMGSVGGWEGEIMAGPYATTKFALEGFTECLKKELALAQLPIKTTIFDVGFFRTKVFSPANIKFHTARKIAEYDPVRAAIDQLMQAYDGKQPGDPKKAVEVMVDVIKGEGVAEGMEWPERLPIGPDAVETLRRKCRATLELCEVWEGKVSGTNFEEGEGS